MYHPGIALHPGVGTVSALATRPGLGTAPVAGSPPGAGPSTDVLDAPSAPVERTDILLFQRCHWCGTAMYHRLLCPVCAGSDLRTEASEGAGIIRHSTVVHRNTPAARNVSLIEMTEGFTVRGRVMGPAATIHSGDRVRLSTAQDPVRREPVFQLVDSLYQSWV